MNSALRELSRSSNKAAAKQPGRTRWPQRAVSFNMRMASHFGDYFKDVMASLPLSRQLAVLAILGWVFGPQVAGAGEASGPAPIFRAVEVDVGPLRRAGDRTSADLMSEDLPAFLNRSLAVRIAPNDRGAPILRVRIESLTFGETDSGRNHGGSTAMDFIDGAAVVVGQTGREVASYPLLCSVLAHPVEIDPSGLSGRLRATNLAQCLADSLPGKLNAR